MRAAVIAYTVNGAILAEKLRHLSDDETDIYVSAKSAKYIDAENIITFKSTPALIRDIFYQYEGIIFIMQYMLFHFCPGMWEAEMNGV